MPEVPLNRYATLVIRFRIAFLAASLLLTGFLFANIKSLHIKLNIDDLMPAEHPYVIAENKLERIFGNKHTVLIGVTANEGSVLKKELIEKIIRITDAILESPEVVQSNVNGLSVRKAKSIEPSDGGMLVKRLVNSELFEGAEIEDLKRRLLLNPVFQDTIVSKDLKTAVIFAEFRRTKKGMKEIDKFVRDIVEKERDPSVDIAISGRPVFQAKFEKAAARMGLFFLISIIIVGLIHLEAFRSWQSLLFPLLTAFLAVIWALGALSLSGNELDVFNISTPILILAVAAGHAVQILKRYYEEYNEILSDNHHLSPKQINLLAVERSIVKVGPVMLAAGSIATLSFLSLLVFDINTIRVFGLFTAFGIASAMVLELMFIPALRAILPSPGPRELMQEKKTTFWARFANWCFDLAYSNRKSVFIAFGIVGLFLAVGAFQLKAENDLRTYLYGKHEQLEDDKKLNDRMAGTYTFQILIDAKQADGIKGPGVLESMNRLQEIVAGHQQVSKSVSLVDYVKQLNWAMNDGDKRQFIIPSSTELISQYLFMYANSGDPGDFDSYVDNDYRYAVIRVFMKSGSSILASQLAEKVLKEGQELFKNTADVSVGGGVLGSVAINEVMVKEKVLNIGQTLFVVFIVASLVFRSLIAGLLILVPLIAAVIANFGFMGWLGIPLQPTTSFISALAVGIGADYSVYLAYRLREEWAQAVDRESSLRKAFLSAGKAILFVSTAMAGGFGVLMFSYGYSAHLWSGALVAISMIVSAFASLTLFPALLFLLRPRFVFRNEDRREI